VKVGELEPALMSRGERWYLFEGHAHDELATAHPTQFAQRGIKDLVGNVLDDLHTSDDVEVVVVIGEFRDRRVTAFDHVVELGVLVESEDVAAEDLLIVVK
jgi:hypothetical protein